MIEQIEQAIMEVVNRIDDVAKKNLPEVTGKLAKHVFDSGGADRNWKANAPSTVKRKKSSDPNIETGLLELTLSQPGFIMDDDYMVKLPVPERTGNPAGYWFANSMREFDNLGRTPEDEKYMEQKLEELLANEFK